MGLFLKGIFDFAFEGLNETCQDFFDEILLVKSNFDRLRKLQRNPLI